MSQIVHRKRLDAARSRNTVDPTFLPRGGRKSALPPASSPVQAPAVLAREPQLAPGAAELLNQAMGGGSRVDEGDGFDLSPMVGERMAEQRAAAQLRVPALGSNIRDVIEREDQRFRDAVAPVSGEDTDPNPTELFS